MIPRARSRRLILLCGLLPTLVVAVLSLYRPSICSASSTASTTGWCALVPARPTSDRIVIIDVDERSLATVGQWPWRRDVIGQLIVSKLRDLGAAVVALDIVFAEPDRFEGGPSPPTPRSAPSLRGGRVVLGYAMTFDGATTARTCVQHPVGLAIVQPPDERSATPFFTRPAPCAISRACRRRPARPGSSTPRPIRTASCGACRCSSSTTATISGAVAGGRGDGHWRTAVGDQGRQREHAADADVLRRHGRSRGRRSTARATCWCAIAARSARSPTSAADVLAGA